MKNYRKNVLKSRNGITLIALVVTIIVLLILAGISISMLSGDNGILQKATQSKEKTEKATVIELAQTEILGQIAENKGETMSETQLKTILGKYFEEISEELPEDLSETNIILTSKEEYGGYTNIELSKIYNGKLTKEKTIKKFALKDLPPWVQTEYEFEDGMTWNDYVNSEYNTNNFVLDNERILFSWLGYVKVDGEVVYPRASSKIDTSIIYIVSPYSDETIEFNIIDRTTNSTYTYEAKKRMSFAQWIDVYSPENVNYYNDYVYVNGYQLYVEGQDFPIGYAAAIDRDSEYYIVSNQSNPGGLN